MKNLLPILALLLLVGCTSEPTELERCIEANYAELTNKTDREEFVASKLKSEMDSAVAKYGEQLDDLKPIDFSSEALNECYKEELTSFVDDIKSREACAPLNENHEDMEKLVQVVIDLEEKHKGEYRETVAVEYYGPEKTKERERFAEKICNAQGIY